MKFNRTIYIFLIITIFFGWFVFSPSESADVYYSQARIYYYIILIPIAILTLIYSLFKLKTVLNNSKKYLIYILLIISFITLIPPLFEKARYILYPLEKIISSKEKKKLEQKKETILKSHYSYFVEESKKEHSVTFSECNYILLDNKFALKILPSEKNKSNSILESNYKDKTITFKTDEYTEFKKNYSSIIPLNCLNKYIQPDINGKTLGALPITIDNITIIK